MDNRPDDDWDPRSPSVLEDQRGAYDEMRETCPVAYSDFLGWSVFRYQDVADILADPTTYSSATKRSAVPNGMDPPAHTVYRGAFEPYFSTQKMARLEGHARRIAADLLERMIATGRADYIGAFAEVFPLKVLCAFLGWPARLWECLGGWTHGNQQQAFSKDRGAGAALAREFEEHVKANLDAHRTDGVDPGDDVTAALLATQVSGSQLSDAEIVSLLRTWTAGHGTVAQALGILAFRVADDTDLQAKVRADPSLLPVIIEEVLRADDPLVANRRTTTREVELQGRTIGAGESLSLMWIAANRDSRAFDDAAIVRLERDTEAALVFGAGIHECLGAPLARLEIRVALEELLARTSFVALEDSEPARRVVYPSNGLVALPLRLS